jgi:hypothetical protein
MILSRRLACVGRDQGIAIFNRETIEWLEHLRTIRPETARPSPVTVPIPVQPFPVGVPVPVQPFPVGVPVPIQPFPVEVPVPVQTSPVVEGHISGTMTVGDPEPSTVLE